VGLVGAVRDCLAAAKAQAGVRVEEIGGLAADATTCTLVPLDARGAPLRRALLWMDVRAAEEARRIFATGDAALRYCLAGANAEWMAPKVLWLRAHEPQVYAETCTLLEYTDWIAWRLTGKLTLNLNTTAQRWFYHTPSGGWPHSLWAALALDDLPHKLPSRLLRAGEIVGGLLPTVAAELGLPPGLPVAACGGDAFIGLLGQGVCAPGDAGLILGSSNVLAALAPGEVHFPGVLGSFPDALIQGLNLLEAGQVSTGSVLAWFARNFGQGAATAGGTDGSTGAGLVGSPGGGAAAGGGPSLFELLDREAARVPPGSGGLIALDHFQGNRTPHTDAAARGMIWGLSLGAERPQVYRALMEGIAYGLQEIVCTLAAHDFPLRRIIASGGATRSAVFMQIYADVLGKAITVTAEPEASLLGSAVVAAVGAGAFADLPAAAAAMARVGRTYTPDPEAHAAYGPYVELHRQTYPQMRGLLHKMHELVAA
jgi:ribulokinase